VARRNFINGAPQLTNQVALSPSDVTITVASTSGYPNVPFTISIERATPNEEVCLVTAKGPTTFTVTRGFDGTVAVSHNTSAVIEHSTTALDYDDANRHIWDTTHDDHTQYVRKALWTAKGAMVVASAANTPAALTVGANGTIPIADSSQTTGVRWGTLSDATAGSSTGAALAQPGDFKMSIISGNHTGWLAMNGQTVVNAQGLYPTLWSVAPSAWKSGSNLVLPNMADTVAAGLGTIYGTLGGISDSNLEIIQETMLPAHYHNMSHNHSASSGNESTTHTHGPGTLRPQQSGSYHQHGAAWGGYLMHGGYNGSDWTVRWYPDGTGSTVPYSSTGYGGNHEHDMAGVTAGQSLNHTHAITVVTYVANTGTAGSGQQFPVTQRGLALNFFIKS
jgi:hypothetical protein